MHSKCNKIYNDKRRIENDSENRRHDVSKMR